MNLHLTCDRTPHTDAPNSPAHLIARITPPSAKPTRTLPPLDLALVIDASGSMSGERLESAKRAAAEVARQLRSEDRLTLVSFADEAIVHLQLTPMTPAGMEEALDAILRLRTRGCTDLCAGWRLAARVLVGDSAVGRRKQVIVLSDGHANRGVVNRGQLANLSREACERGVTTSAVGVGDGYSPEQLEALCNHGGGELHDAASAERMFELVMSELGALREVVGERASLCLALPNGVRVRELSGLASLREQGQLRVDLGALYSGRERVVVLRVDVDRDVDELELRARLEWHEPGSFDGRQSIERSTRTRCASWFGDADRSVRPEDAEVVVKAWWAGLVQRITEANRDRDFETVRRIEREELEAFREYSGRHDLTRRFAPRAVHFVRDATSHVLECREALAVHDIAKKHSKGMPTRETDSFDTAI